MAVILLLLMVALMISLQAFSQARELFSSSLGTLVGIIKHEVWPATNVTIFSGVNEREPFRKAACTSNVLC